MTQEQREKVGKILAKLVYPTMLKENITEKGNEVNPLDGDETEDIAKYFLQELDDINGNK